MVTLGHLLSTLPTADRRFTCRSIRVNPLYQTLTKLLSQALWTLDLEEQFHSSLL
jgi:hypothetical protein